MGAEGPQPLLYPLEKPRITLLIQLVVIVFKHSVKGLEFSKYERLGAEGPRQASLVSSWQTSNNFVGLIGCHRVQTFCEGS